MSVVGLNMSALLDADKLTTAELELAAFETLDSTMTQLRCVSEATGVGDLEGCEISGAIFACNQNLDLVRALFSRVSTANSEAQVKS